MPAIKGFFLGRIKPSLFSFSTITFFSITFFSVCFIGFGSGSNTSISNNVLKIKFRDKFLFRRGRINCSLNDNGTWRWFGIQFSVKTD